MAKPPAPPRIAKRMKPGKPVKSDMPAPPAKPMGKGKKKKGAY